MTPASTQRSLLLEAVHDAARVAGDIAMRHYRTALAVESKADGSPVTIADREAEGAVREWISRRFPEDGIEGEELGVTRRDASRRWVIDPIDGTKTFIRGVPLWGSLIAVVENREVLAGAAYMFEYEELDAREGTVDAGERSVFHRASFYVTGTHKLGEGVSITETVYVQPRLRHPSDVRVFAELAVTSKLSKRLALSDALTFAYDRTPPDEIERLDTQLVVSLILTI